jgi:hypothetical protein
LCAAFKGINARMDMSVWRSPSPWPPSETSVKDYVDQYCKCVPPGYDVGYRDLLRINAALVAAGLREAYSSRLNAGWPESSARSYALLRSDSLLGAASAWDRSRAATSPQCPVPLVAVQRFAAVVADLFEAFTRVPLVHKLLPALPPPLVTFATEPDLGPASLIANEVRKYTTADIDIVSQPFGYAEVPLLWGLLAHETSGHCAMHRIEGFVDELSRMCANSVGSSAAGINLWGIWAEEAAADVLGLLNVGPSFALSLGAWLKMSKPTETMNTSIAILGPDLTDKHPVDPLRLSVLKGAVGKLVDYERSRDRWTEAIDAAIAGAAPGVQSFDLLYGDPLHPKPIPRSQLQQEAEKIGATIVTSRFASLGHRGIQRIMTWTEDDESRAAAVKEAAAKRAGTLSVADADDAHLLAGATMALADDPTLYCSLNRRLNDAFDESFRKDEIFRGWHPH